MCGGGSSEGGAGNVLGSPCPPPAIHGAPGTGLGPVSSFRSGEERWGQENGGGWFERCSNFSLSAR